MVAPDPGHWKIRKDFAASIGLESKNQCKVDLAFVQPFDQRRVAINGSFHARGRMRALETAERRRQPRLGKITRHPEAHRTVNRQTRHGVNSLVIEIENPARVSEKNLARLGQREAAALLAKQRLTNAL